jgi:hypothetical protein
MTKMKWFKIYMLISLLSWGAVIAATAQANWPTSAKGYEQASPSLPSLQSNIVPGQNFDGLGQNSFAITDTSIPPDPAGAVGTTQYIEWVNPWFAVFNKGTGDLVYPPIPGSLIWANLGGPCDDYYDDSQPVVQFDKLAQRWVIGQLVVQGPPYYFCVAVSTTADGTPNAGNYTLYSIALNDLPDSLRLATWPDAYYVTFNMYSGAQFLYSEVCALDRTSLLNGLPPQPPQCQQTPNFGLLPSDIDGTMPPPAGSPNYLLSLGHNALDFWTFAVNFSQGTSQLSGPTAIPVQAFSGACSSINCIPQKGTSQDLESLSDRLMYRAAYRNFGDHESLTVNHTIVFALRYAAMRWYELRNPSSGTPTVYQYGTYVPTSIHRWMGNVGMDGMSDLVAAYNFSSAGLHPSINFTDRAATDPLNTLRGENLIMSGTGSQTQGYQWGKSTSLSVDPVDDCTFWTAGEYLRADGTNNWNTRISSFSLATCPSDLPAIQITNAPPFGQDGPLSGTVSNVNFNDYQVGVLLFVPGVGWFSKPTCAQLFVPIGSDGSWHSAVDSGGEGDFTATKYAAYLVPLNATASCQSGVDGLPFDLETEAVGRAFINRPNTAAYLQFSGLNWEITQNPYLLLYPGPCAFSANNVSVDGNGNLHLKITDDSGTWHCAQVATPPQPLMGQQASQTYGYGTYTFNLASAVDGLDPNVVFGLFTWSDDPAYPGPLSPWTNNPGGGIPSHSELDVEFSRWGIPTGPNAQFAVQPYTNNGARYQFTMPPGYNTSTAIIYWFPDGISFKVQDSNGNIIQQYSYPGPVPPPGENGGWMGLPNLQQVRLNLWLYNGQPPQNGQNAEVVLSNFSYTPYTN